MLKVIKLVETNNVDSSSYDTSDIIPVLKQVIAESHSTDPDKKRKLYYTQLSDSLVVLEGTEEEGKLLSELFSKLDDWIELQ